MMNMKLKATTNHKKLLARDQLFSEAQHLVRQLAYSTTMPSSINSKENSKASKSDQN